MLWQPEDDPNLIAANLEWLEGYHAAMQPYLAGGAYQNSVLKKASGDMQRGQGLRVRLSGSALFPDGQAISRKPLLAAMAPAGGPRGFHTVPGAAPNPSRPGTASDSALQR